MTGSSDRHQSAGEHSFKAALTALEGVWGEEEEEEGERENRPESQMNCRTLIAGWNSLLDNFNRFLAVALPRKWSNVALIILGRGGDGVRGRENRTGGEDFERRLCAFVVHTAPPVVF